MYRNIIFLSLVSAAALYSAEQPHCGLQEPRCGCFARGAPNAGGGAFEFEFLWWRAENHGFSTALNESSGGLYTTVDGGDSVGSILRVQPNWDPGLRLGFGWNSDYDRWDLFVNWTWYLNHAKSTNIRSDLPIDAASTDGFYPEWPLANFTGFGPYRTAYGSWKMLYNAIDVEVGRAYFTTPALSFRPICSLRTAWINQKFISKFSQPLQPDIASRQEFFAKNNWWGIGPRLGVESDWKIGLGIYLLGKASTSLLYGKTSVWTISDSQPAGLSSFVLDRRFVDAFYALVPNLQLFLGIGWKRFVNCGRIAFSIDAGWEANYWWNQFNLPIALRTFAAPLPTVGNQPVTMEGLTLDFHIDF